MSRNLSQAPHGDVIERALPFEARKRPFYRCSLLPQSNIARQRKLYAPLGQQLLMPRIDVNHWSGPILPVDKDVQVAYSPKGRNAPFEA